MNRVCLIGRIGKDPESRLTTNGKTVCSFSIAVSGRSKEDASQWFRVNCWEKTAQYVSDYLGKGRLVAVDGRLQSRKYTASDGSSREVVEIVAESVQGLDRPKDDVEPVARAAAPTSEADEFDPFQD